GKQSNAVKCDPFLRQLPRNSCRPGRAVALSQQEQRRGPAVITRYVQANELAECVNVPFDAPEFLADLRCFRATESRADGVYQDEVALVEQRVLIVFQVVRGRGQKSIAIECHASRP